MTISPTAFPNTLLAETSDFVIGAYLGVSGGTSFLQQFTGVMDELRIWNVARTLAEINSTRFSVLNGNEPGLRGYWRFNEGAGQTVANSATATGSALNGTLGLNSNSELTDPTWSFATSAPILYCAPSTGQANSPASSLRVNGVGAIGVQGPFHIQIPTSGPAANRVTLTWAGPPNMPLFLAAGTLQTNTAIVPCAGSIDLALTYTIVGDFFTSPFPLNYLFLLDASGQAETTFTVPASVLGTPWVSLQGAVPNVSCAIPLTLTAAFELR